MELYPTSVSAAILLEAVAAGTVMGQNAIWGNKKAFVRHFL